MKKLYIDMEMNELKQYRILEVGSKEYKILVFPDYDELLDPEKTDRFQIYRIDDKLYASMNVKTHYIRFIVSEEESIKVRRDLYLSKSIGIDKHDL
jgi:hypothetical protein